MKHPLVRLAPTLVASALTLGCGGGTTQPGVTQYFVAVVETKEPQILGDTLYHREMRLQVTDVNGQPVMSVAVRGRATAGTFTYPSTKTDANGKLTAIWEIPHPENYAGTVVTAAFCSASAGVGDGVGQCQPDLNADGAVRIPF